MQHPKVTNRGAFGANAKQLWCATASDGVSGIMLTFRVWQVPMLIRRLPCQIYGADIGSTILDRRQGTHPCQYLYGKSLIGHLRPEDRPLVATALKRMFCMYTDYCEGPLKGKESYNLRWGG